MNAPAIAEQSALTEAHRLACEVRLVLSWPLDKRRAYLADVQRHRGDAGVQYLKDAIQAEFYRRKEGTCN